MHMTARQQSRSPNQYLHWKPNQFPKSRIGDITRTSFETIENVEDTDNDITDEEQSKREYLRNRFKSTDRSGVDGPSGPCGE